MSDVAHFDCCDHCLGYCEPPGFGHYLPCSWCNESDAPVPVGPTKEGKQ